MENILNHLPECHARILKNVLEKIHEEKDKDSKLDYGIRLSAKLDLGRFVIGADLSQSLNGMGFSAGVNLGLKIFKKKKYY